MGFVILALFIAVPAIEIGLFIEVGGRVGVFATLGLIVLTAIIGTGLLRRQGLATVRRAQQSLEAGEVPVSSLFDGLCLFAAGVLLLTPGFFTDAIGFLLFVPPVRGVLGLWLGRHLQPGPGGGGASSAHWHWQSDVHWQESRRSDEVSENGVIEGDYEDLTPNSTPKRPQGPDAKTKELPPKDGGN